MYLDFGNKTNAFKVGIQFQVDDNFKYTKAAGFSFSLDKDKYVIFSSTKDDLNAKRLHRVLMEAAAGTYIDHADGDPLNNKLENLRFCTLKQNGANRGKQKNNTSGYKGVSFNKKAQKYKAEINRIYIGHFDTAELAYQAYCVKAIELHGEFVNLG